jgi:hypothetical protein
MGTSSNQSSPRRDPSWIAARIALANSAFPVDRQSKELWRAAAADVDADLQRRIGDSVFAQAATLAQSHLSSEGAVTAFQNVLDKASAASVFTEIGKRALARASQSTQGSIGFAGELFAETASYYVSRDLPSVVGLNARPTSVKAALSIKQLVCNQARTAAASIAASSGIFSNSKSISTREWRAYVSAVITALKGQS